MTTSEQSSVGVDELRLATRGLGPDEWRSRYRDAVVEAHRDEDPSRVAELTIVSAAHLESEGLIEEALSEVTLSRALLADEPLSSALAELWGLQIVLQALGGDLERARGEARDLSALAAESGDERARVTAETFVAVVGCIGLDPPPIADLRQLIGKAERLGCGWLSSGLRAWATPHLAATGRLVEASSWAGALELQAEAQAHAWREDDAAALTLALRLAQGESDSHWDWKTRNPRARRVAALARLAFRSRSESRILDGALAELEEISPQIAGADPYRLFLEARHGTASEVGLIPPHTLTLLTLPDALAAAEAVAVTGSQDSAVSWLRWFDEQVPEDVLTCLEWPVSVQRVRGLLAARAGALELSIRLLREAVATAREIGLQAEVVIAQLQLAELLAAAPTAARRQEWESIRRSVQRDAEALELPIHTHVAVASAAVALARFDGAKPVLTTREIEVLARMAEGGTYKSVGAELGVSWQTVRKHCSNAYEKLGANGRIEAIKQASDLGML